MNVQHWDVERARARWLQLADPVAVRELEAEREAAVIDRRIADRAPGAYFPRPHARPFENPTREPYGHDNTQLGLDAEGRVVIERRVVDGRVVEATELYSWGPGWCEVLAVLQAVPWQLRVFNLAGGRLTEEIALDGQQRPDGQPAVEVRRWQYGHGRPTFALDTYECQIGGQWGWRARRYGFVYDAQGELEQITYTTSPELVCGMTGADDAQATARAGSAGAFPAELPLFDARPRPQPAPINVRSEVKPPAPSADALTALLGRLLAQHGVDIKGPGFDLAGDPDRFERVWKAVQAFAAAPVDGLYPGLRIPLPRYRDMDGMSLDLDTRGPVVLTFERQVYLVDTDDEHQASDAAGLSLQLDMETPKARTIIEGVGGPPNGANDGALSWIAAIENHPTWAAIRQASPAGRATWY